MQLPSGIVPSLNYHVILDFTIFTTFGTSKNTINLTIIATNTTLALGNLKL